MELEFIARYRIQQARRLLGLTQKQAAERAEMPYQTWLNYEQGRVEITLPILRTIARTLEKPPEYFIISDPDVTTIEKQIIDRLPTLSERDQQELLAIIRIKEQLNRTASGKAAEGEPSPKVHTKRQGEKQGAP